MNAQLGIQKENNNPSIIKPVTDRQKEKLALELDSLISATITAKANGKTVLTTMDNIAIQADSSNIEGDIGDEVYFKVISAGGKAVLKQIPKPEAQSFGHTLMKLKSTAELKEMFRQSGFSGHDHATSEKADIEQELKEAQAIAKIRRQLSTAGKTDVNITNELVASGVSLNKINLSLLNSALKEVNSKPRFKGGKEISNDTEPVSDEIARRFSDIRHLRDNEISCIIKSEKKLTLDNIYMLKHSAAATEPNKEIVSSLRGEIIRVLGENDLPASDENISASEWLISYEIDLTKENILKLAFLKNLENMEGVPLPQNGSSGVDLFEYSEDRAKYALYDNYTDIINNFPRILTSDIDLLITRQIPVTLNSLKIAPVIDPKLYGEAGTESDAAKAARNQLVDIQLRLTHEAAIRLAAKNVSIAEAPLAKALDILKKQEQDNYASSLNLMGHTADEESSGIMRDLFEKLRVFDHITHSSLGNVIKMILTGSETSSSVSTWRRTGSALSTKAVRSADFNVNNTYDAITSVAELYEQNSTPARISKPFTNLDDHLKDFLEGIGFKASKKNLSSAKILFNNGLDITAENISQVKLIAAKIERLYNTLHPNIAASMIKEGINPLTEHIDNMLEYVDNFNNMYGENLGDKIASFIYEADMNSSYTAEERQGVIGIYRMLNAMLNNGGAGIGQIVRNKTPLTLGNMMDTAKQISRRHPRDYRVDDKFGENSSSDDVKSDIRSSIQSALNAPEQVINEENETESSRQQAYMEFILKAISENAYPEHLRELIKRGADAENMTMDDIIDFLADQAKHNPEAAENHVNELARESAKWLQELSSTNPRMIKWMMDNNLSCNINSILTMQKAVKDPFFLSKRLDGAVTELNMDEELRDKVFDIDLDGLKTTDDITAALSEFDRALENAEHKINGEPGKVWNKLSAVREARDAIKHNNELVAQGSKEYKIPVKLQDRVSSLNMYFINDNMDDGNVLLALETESLGVVQVYAKNTGGKLSLTVTVENESDVRWLENNVDMLVGYIRESGFASRQIEVNFTVLPMENRLEKEINTPLNALEESNTPQNLYTPGGSVYLYNAFA